MDIDRLTWYSMASTVWHVPHAADSSRAVWLSPEVVVWQVTLARGRGVVAPASWGPDGQEPPASALRGEEVPDMPQSGWWKITWTVIIALCHVRQSPKVLPDLWVSNMHAIIVLKPFCKGRGSCLPSTPLYKIKIGNHHFICLCSTSVTF